jgi:SAM-dependent methyltransferase
MRTGSTIEAYADEYFDTEDPSRGHRDFTSEWATEYDRRRFGRELDHIAGDIAPGRLLDLGAATGSYVAMARERGWHADGVEPSAGARRLAAARGVDLVPDLADLPAADLYDVATLHHVLEHVEDPVALLRMVRPRLHPGGRLVVEVPNWRSTERVATGTDWVDLRPEQHRWQFTPATLAAVVRRAGYQLVEVTTLGDPMPSPGSVVHSLGVPTAPIRRRRARNRVGPSERTPRIRSEQDGIARIAAVIDRSLRTVRLGKRLLVVATPQSRAAARAGALESTTP